MIKEAFIDSETSGTDLMRHGLFMIGGIIRINGQIKEEFNIACDLFKEDEFDEESTKVHGYTAEDLHQFQDPTDAHKELTDLFGKHVDKFDKTDKYHFIGYGAEWDNKFIRRWFEGCGDNFFGSWFWNPWIDVMSLAAEALKEIRSSMPNFQLATVARRLGIEVDSDQIHDALYDSRIAMAVYDHVIKIDPGVSENKDGTFRYRMKRR